MFVLVSMQLRNHDSRHKISER